MRVLVLNPGSSSLKSAVVDSPAALDAAAAAAEAAAPPPLAEFDVNWGVDASEDADPGRDIVALLGRYEKAGIARSSLGAVGYRVVHGGERFRERVLVTPQVIAGVEALLDLAPLHNGVAVKAMRAGLAAAPELPHVAVFDTAFHATLPVEAYRYPVPGEWLSEWGVRRYGFHGLSVAWSVERAAVLLGRPAAELRLVVAHLGSGCSVTAVDGGRSVATSMGMTPLEGLMMGTRSGSIDPGILFYVLRTGHMTAEEMEDGLDHHSGLLGVSGRTSDVRELLTMEASGDEDAKLALVMFARRAAAEIASAMTALPALDAIVFTAGIGEHSAAMRARIVARLASVGVAPILERDVSDDCALSAAGVRPAVLRIAAREDLIVAREAALLVGGRATR